MHHKAFRRVRTCDNNSSKLGTKAVNCDFVTSKGCCREFAYKSITEEPKGSPVNMGKKPLSACNACSAFWVFPWLNADSSSISSCAKLCSKVTKSCCSCSGSWANSFARVKSSSKDMGSRPINRLRLKDNSSHESLITKTSALSF